MQKKLWRIGSLAAVLLGFSIMFFSKEKTIKADFVCAGGKGITAIFTPDHDIDVKLKLSDGRKLTLPRAMSASGARYASGDESIVFWNKGNTAFMTEKDKVTFDGCMVEGEGK